MVVISTYLIGAAIYTAMDLTLKPQALRKYKNQPGENEPLDFNKLRKVQIKSPMIAAMLQSITRLCNVFRKSDPEGLLIITDTVESLILQPLILIALNLASTFPLAMSNWSIIEKRGISDVRTLPNFSTAFFQFLGCWVMEEIGFYYTHR